MSRCLCVRALTPSLSLRRFAEFIVTFPLTHTHTPAHTHTHTHSPLLCARHAGPGALLQSCLIENEAEVGAGAVICEGAIVEAAAKVEDGAVVHPGLRIPAGQVWGGNPAVFIRERTKTELAEIQGHAQETAALAEEHAAEFLPYTTAYRR